MKKHFFILLTVLSFLALSFSACSNNNDTQETKKMGFISNIDEKNNTFDFDEVEWIDLENTKRIEELNIDKNIDMPNGFYIYNESEEKSTIFFDKTTEFTYIDWENNGSVNITTTDISKFINYYNTYKETTPPFIVTYDKNLKASSVLEQYVP